MCVFGRGVGWGVTSGSTFCALWSTYNVCLIPRQRQTFNLLLSCCSYNNPPPNPNTALKFIHCVVINVVFLTFYFAAKLDWNTYPADTLLKGTWKVLRMCQCQSFIFPLNIFQAKPGTQPVPVSYCCLFSLNLISLTLAHWAHFIIISDFSKCMGFGDSRSLTARRGRD